MNLQSLRSLIGAKTEMQLESYSHPQFPQGIVKGGITEFFGPGKSSQAAALLREHPTTKAAWIETEIQVYPCALKLLGVTLDRILFVEAKRDLVWAVLQIIKSQLFQFVIIHSSHWNLKDLRRLQLSAERSGVSVIFLSEIPHSAWPIRRQYEAKAK